MPLPLAAIGVNIGLQIAKDPKSRKFIIAGLIAVPLVFILLIGMIGAAISGMTANQQAAAVVVQDDYCHNSASGTTGLYGGGEYSGGAGGINLMKFLSEQDLSFYQARIAWSVGMRESGGTSYTSTTPRFNGFDYGVWQINQVHTDKVAEIGEKLEGRPWSMDEMGGDIYKSYRVMMWFSNKTQNMISWGLAPNQPQDGVVFDWRRYVGQNAPNGGDWITELSGTAEDNYMKFYNEFPSAMQQAGVSFRGAPANLPKPASSPGPVFQVNPSKTPTAPVQGPAAPTKPSVPVTIAKPEYNLVNPDGTLNPPVNSGREAVRVKDSLGMWTSSQYVSAVVPASVPPEGSYTVEGHLGIPSGSPDLETFEFAGHNYTVAREWVPTFRAFLIDWQASPALGRGRLSLDYPDPLVFGSYNWRWAKAAPGKLSDHAGYAIDLRTDILPADNKRHMTDAETQAVRTILQKYPQLGWGGNYTTKIDEMHIYVQGGAVAGDTVGAAVPTFIVGDEGILDPFISGGNNGGPLAVALAQWPYTIEQAKDMTMDEGISILRTNENAKVSGVWVLFLGSVEARVGEEEEEENGSNSASPSPTATPELLKPEVMENYIRRVMNASGYVADPTEGGNVGTNRGAARPVYWLKILSPDPSQQIVNDALEAARSKYPTLRLIDVDASPAAGLVTKEGKLTREGAEYVSAQIATGVADSQPAYTARQECQDYLFSSSNGITPILDGKFSTRTDYTIPNAAEIVATANSFIGTTNAPCGRCIGKCDRLAANINGSPNSGYKSARTHWNYTLDGTGRYGTGHPGDTSIPLGALVFFDGHPIYGHVATYVGEENGVPMVVSNYSGPNGDAVYPVPLSNMAAAYGYYGWAEPVFPGPE